MAIKLRVEGNGRGKKRKKCFLVRYLCIVSLLTLVAPKLKQGDRSTLPPGFTYL